MLGGLIALTQSKMAWYNLLSNIGECTYMKRKTLLFILALVFIFPCAILLTACGGDKNALNITVTSSSDRVAIMDIGAESEFDTRYAGSGCTQTEYSVWVQDCCDKDTLKVYLDGTEITLTEVVDANEYASRQLSTNKRKIATFKLDKNLKGNHNITYTVDIENVTIRFVDNNQFSSYTESEKKTLKDWYFTESDGTLSDSLYDLLYAQVFSGAQPYSFDIPYDQLNNSIKYTCSKPLGYYYSYFFWLVSEGAPISGVSYINETTDGDIRYSHYVGMPFDSVDVAIPNDSPVDIYAVSAVNNHGDSIVGLAKLGIRNIEDSSGTTVDYEIYQIKNGDIRTNAGVTTWTITNENDIKVYFEHREGADFTNLKVYLYEQEVTLHADGEDRYFVLEKGKLPIDYCSDLNILNEYAYLIRVEGIELSDDYFAIITATTKLDNDSSQNYLSAINSRKYFWDNGVIYHIKNEQVDASYAFVIDSATLTGLYFNDELIDLSDKNTFRTDLPKHDVDYTGSDFAWEDDAISGNYYYRITTNNGDNILIKIIIDTLDGDTYGKVNAVNIVFNLTNNTNLQLVFETNN